ncbi:DNA/RNA non-specific endonuclease [Enterococcus diestrammenae]|uniref:DNA/RNA non-specific endonuclease n=1 Tax=Enterococcus diestrammenae TaxID=1155073 RepID=UPI0022E84DF0|nr:DNA/RNA non-specific endonuclease [Enterococcus diestrammenae]
MKKSKKVKKVFPLLFSLGLLFSGVTGCSDAGTAKGKEETKATATQEQVAKKAAAAKKEEEKAAKEKAEKEQATKKQAVAEAKAKAEEEKAEKEEAAAKAKAAKAKEHAKQMIIAQQKKVVNELANLEYQGTQTIEANDGVPLFTEEDLSLTDGAWESYGDLDSLNRVTGANAMLNQSLMPTEERGDISAIQPTGWKNKKIKGGYLYNRSHLIGFALSGENANWKNLMTGTRQLNSPEMLSFEMDLKYYLEEDSNRYVRYRVTPIFRGDELLARGVQLEAQSIGSNAVSFNMYIFNIQDGVTLNYADGSSEIDSNDQSDTGELKTETPTSDTTNNGGQGTASDDQEYVDENGNGLIKGSNSGIYHVPGSTYYNRTTNPKQMFKTVREAVAAGYRAPKG